MRLKKDMHSRDGIIKGGTEVRAATDAELASIDAELASTDATGERAEFAAALRALVRSGKVVAFVPEGSSKVMYASSLNFDV